MKLALLTIGQSPRYDIMNDVGHLLRNVDYIERGILDGLSKEYIERELAPKLNEDFYITRLRDGSQVKISKSLADKMMAKLVKEVEEYVDLIIIMCTGDFNVSSRKPLLLPSKIIMKVVESLSLNSLGVLVPGKGQESMAYNRWAKVVRNVKVFAWSPYTDSEDVLKAIAERLKDTDMIVMDCVGFSTRHGELVKRITHKPVIVPRYLIISIAISLI